MRRTVVFVTAIAALIAAATAYAVVTNTYTATGKVSPGKAGSAASPSPVGLTFDYTADGNNGNRTAPLTDIKNTVYGLQSNGKLFPACTAAAINVAKSESVCKKGSQVGTGHLTALIGPTAVTLKSLNPGAPCTKNIHIYNAGQGKLTFILVGPAAACAGVGFLPAFPATLTVSGGTFKIDAPVPDYISHPVPKIDGSLTTEHIAYNKLTKKVKGKTRGFLESVACKKRKRPYTTSFTANGLTVTIPHTLSCK
jgi:hypothetical protein